MILVLKKDTTPRQEAQLLAYLEQLGLAVTREACEGSAVWLLSGGTERVDSGLLSSLPMVESVLPTADPLPLASRRSHPADTVVQVGEASIGGGRFCMMAGPCTVESEEQLLAVARSVKASGAQLLRGGAYKPRTSPYDFSGLREKGLELLRKARRETGLPVVSEIMSAADLPLFEDIDVLQVGARNMQNFDLLSAEYILAGGNKNVILCERGIRTFSGGVRSTLDLTAVPLLHELTHLPVIVDPSHATGKSRLVPPMALAAAACGCDGLLIEVHNDPLHALCDGGQALLPAEFADLSRRVAALLEVVRR